jgi:hypothetical protein
MSNEEKYKRMEAALRNILEISSDEFSLSQARFGLGIENPEAQEDSHE